MRQMDEHDQEAGLEVIVYAQTSRTSLLATFKKVEG